MLSEWLYVGVFFLIAMFLPAAAIFIAGILAPKKPNPIKSSTYECGIETVGPAWIQFKAQYYIYTLVFLVFDVEVVLLFPWAVAYHQLPLFAVVEGVIFILILLGGLLYAWRKRALEWL
ncbi:MAG TPA: NADH-quinone oxidoreductase subunit A [Anaerolinea thermolimosa]|uniref:NADH-quinone oxidoreductase subunit A n=2 Tax=Anaerolinea thermolimosa TaxID=229919 RepID=A0A3D1JJ23_9CHLR|nr:NADH-quinone oxidoreductase subunit A [Anaerolinea thermolimosa]GAP05812.1 NADH dehydrogenase subunit A [Anaerolinea thermolimosa]HCE17626.1 NADH-quinone oxidoreductase subunit A [Anaerolinea thermolimosa]